jgi:hypothetical protein
MRHHALRHHALRCHSPSRRTPRHRSLTAAVTLFAALLAVPNLAAAAPEPAAVPNAPVAAPGAREDRLLTTPTRWWTYGNISANSVAAQLDAHGARLTDLHVDSVTPLRFTVTMVRNTGAYALGSRWFYDEMWPQWVDRTIWDDLRPTVVREYLDGQTPYYAGVLVDNPGAARDWNFYRGTAADVTAGLARTGDRLVSLTAFPAGTSRRFLAMGVPNTESYRWAWHHDVSAATLNARIARSGGRLVDLDRNPDGTWDAIVYDVPGRSSWFSGQTLTKLKQRAAAQNARLIDVTPYRSGRSVRYAGVLSEN